MPEHDKDQDAATVFALDIGTRSVIGVLGRAENGRFHVLELEEEEHAHRAMMDGQIEDIEQVTAAARVVMQRLEERSKLRLKRVCVAAAGRALKSERASFTLEFQAPKKIDEELVAQLEAGAVSTAEQAISELPDQTHNGLYMVGYTVSQYRLNGYPMSTLIGHSGKNIECDVVATFLPREVVESLYSVVAQLELEVSSLTLEPIAALNAAIPAELRLLNLVLVDIGAGTSDIAVCRDGSVVGYTMATIAGDEVTELLMRSLLVDFKTAEQLKSCLSSDSPAHYTDILGIPHEVTTEELRSLTEPAAQMLAKEIGARILELNGSMPSAVFLAGGGSKLYGLQKCVAEALHMDSARVAVAGTYFAKSAFSSEYSFNDPEYATPLGIAISAALGLIHDSYVILLNSAPAKLFRSGSLVLRDILLMNGYTYGDMIGRTGANLTVTLNGERLFLRGDPAVAPIILLNGKEALLSTVVHAGDSIQFTPAKAGADASKTLAELLGPDFSGEVLVNGSNAAPEDRVHTGDVIVTVSTPAPTQQPTLPTDINELPEQSVDRSAQKPLSLILNGKPLTLPPKPSGDFYYLMDILQYCNLDFSKLTRPVNLLINGSEGQFTQILRENDTISVRSIR
ncbi:MAG: cell division protein FtsA [Lawsonibacter sp.]